MRRKTGKTAVARACMGGSGPAYVRAQVRPLAGDGVERPLQDVGGRHLVDDLGTALAGHVGLADQEALDRGGGEPLVPERDGLREAGLLDEIAGELAHRLAARPFAAVPVHRPADDQAADAVVAAAHGAAGGIVAALAAPARLEPPGDEPKTG